MNEKILYVDGKVVVIGSKGEDSVREYTDNIEDRLVSENIIERTEKQLKDEKENLFNLKSFKKSLSRFNSGGVIMGLLFFGATIFCFAPVIINPLLPVLPVAITFGAGSILIEALVISKWVHQYKRAKKEIDGTEREIKFLNIKLVEEKHRLYKLEQIKTKENEINFAEKNSIQNNHFRRLNDSEIMSDLELDLLGDNNINNALEQGLSSDDKEKVNGMTEATGDPSYNHRKGKAKVLKSKKKR